MSTNETTKMLARNTGFGISHGKSGGPLKDRFAYPPYSLWNTRDDFWIKRRRQWLRLGIKSEEGRDGKLTFNIPMTLSDGRQGNRIKSQTSIFDPVVCELVNSWWCKPGGVILDPFAGGSVRGLVAAMLGFRYWGGELRAEQVEANKGQRADMRENIELMDGHPPKWVCGDSTVTVPTAPACDMVFSCPPYGNLEAYSDDPADLSNMPYDGFIEAYGEIIRLACDKLRDNRFACYVVANYRDKKTGQMRDLVGDTNRCFAAAGLELYNEVILLNSVGTGAMRANTSFVRGARKVVKTHQNILVYVKGDPKVAAEDIPASVGPDSNLGDDNGGD